MTATDKPENTRNAYMDHKQAKKIFKAGRKFIKKCLKQKINAYAPLEFKPIHKLFLEKIRNNGFSLIREMPKD
ncbi:MAG: hypothetical protein GY765_06325, partial [bacterium]|nr:hypothetical protein [bacterium]